VIFLHSDRKIKMNNIVFIYLIFNPSHKNNKHVIILSISDYWGHHGKICIEIVFTKITMQFCIFTSTNDIVLDPCHQYFYENLKVDDNARPDVCNKNLTDNWYLIGNYEYDAKTLSTECPNKSDCSTQSPLWIDCR